MVERSDSTLTIPDSCHSSHSIGIASDLLQTPRKEIAKEVEETPCAPWRTRLSVVQTGGAIPIFQIDASLRIDRLNAEDTTEQRGSNGRKRKRVHCRGKREKESDLATLIPDLPSIRTIVTSTPISATCHAPIHLSLPPLVLSSFIRKFTDLLEIDAIQESMTNEVLKMSGEGAMIQDDGLFRDCVYEYLKARYVVRVRKAWSEFISRHTLETRDRRDGERYERCELITPPPSDSFIPSSPSSPSVPSFPSSEASVSVGFLSTGTRSGTWTSDRSPLDPLSHSLLNNQIQSQSQSQPQTRSKRYRQKPRVQVKGKEKQTEQDLIYRETSGLQLPPWPSSGRITHLSPTPTNRPIHTSTNTNTLASLTRENKRKKR